MPFRHTAILYYNMKINELSDIIVSAPQPPENWRIGHSFKLPFFSPPVLTVTQQKYMYPFSVIWGAIKPKKYLTIGVLYGSTESYAMWRTKHKPERIVACDIDLAEYNPERNNLAYAHDNLSRNNDGEIVTIRCNSKTCYMMELLGPYDLVFIDGEHTAEAVYADLNHAKKSIAPEGIIMVHDLELHTSSVLTGYKDWLNVNKEFNHIEVSRQHFHLGLGLVQC